MLTNADIDELTDLRHELHRFPEVSGQEQATAARIYKAIQTLAPTETLTGLGGHGVAAIFDSGVAGPTVLFRAELDALPIPEKSDQPWTSEHDGVGHLCGHDGHMTTLLAFGRLIARTPVAKGRVVLMFQPAEEDGSGARRVTEDPAFSRLAPDWAFAIHNDPGRPLGTAATRAGLMNCASLGLEIKFEGKTAHAASPDDGLAPTTAITALIPKLASLGTGGALSDDFRLSTITHLQIGEPTFGIAPGRARLFVTLRSATDAAQSDMLTAAKALAEDAATSHGLTVSFAVHDEFAASINDPDAAQIALEAMVARGLPRDDSALPMRASEDFGLFGRSAKAAMITLGAGESHPALHNPDYDFPDALIPLGAHLFEKIARTLLGPNG